MIVYLKRMIYHGAQVVPPGCFIRLALVQQKFFLITNTSKMLLIRMPARNCLYPKIIKGAIY